MKNMLRMVTMQRNISYTHWKGLHYCRTVVKSSCLVVHTGNNKKWKLFLYIICTFKRY